MKNVLVAVFSICFGSMFAQIGGRNAFSFLEAAYSAKSLSLGGDAISIVDDNAFLSVDNPALLNERFNKHLSIHQAFLPAGINYGMLHYTKDLKSEWTGAAHFRFFDYVKMIHRDAIGNDLGTFHPLDFALGATVAKPFSPKFSIGLTLNFLYSQLESYTSVGSAIDFAGLYNDPDKNLSAAFVVKNAGFQFKSYAGDRNPLPVEVQAAVTKKLKYAPFRFSLLGHHLNIWDLSYADPNAPLQIDALTGDTLEANRAGFGEKFFRHFSYQVEILLTEKVHVRAGFDYNRRQEFKIAATPGASGFSFGTGLNFKRFSFDYGFVVYSRAGYQHMISLQSDLSKWRRRTN